MLAAQELAKTIIYDFGDHVGFAIQTGKDDGIVTDIKLSPGAVIYTVTWSNKSISDHYDFELTKGKDKHKN